MLFRRLRWNHIHDADEFEIEEILIGEQLRGAPYLEKFGVEPIPTGYVVFSPGGKVGEVGDELIDEGQEDTVYAYALTAKMFGFKVLYLEAGSGASTQVDVSSIESARRVEELCLVVGGGITSGEMAARAAKAEQMIVTEL